MNFKDIYLEIKFYCIVYDFNGNFLNLSELNILTLINTYLLIKFHDSEE